MGALVKCKGVAMVLSAYMAFEGIAENLAMRGEDVNCLADADDDSNSAEFGGVLLAATDVDKYVVS